MLMGTLPVAVPLRTRLKFTRPGAAVTVMPVLSVALRLTVAGFDFNCARAPEGSSASKTAMQASTGPRAPGNRDSFSHGLLGRFKF